MSINNGMAAHARIAKRPERRAANEKKLVHSRLLTDIQLLLSDADRTHRLAERERVSEWSCRTPLKNGSPIKITSLYRRVESSASYGEESSARSNL